MRPSFLNTIEKSLDTMHFLYRAAPFIFGICFVVALLICSIIILAIL